MTIRLTLFLLDEFQRCRIDAVAKSGWIGSIIKDVTEVRVALAAHDFRPNHPVAVIRFTFDVLLRRWRPEAGPAGTRFKFCFRAEQWLPAAYAHVCPGIVVVPIFARERALSPLFSRDFKLQRCELFLPFVF